MLSKSKFLKTTILAALAGLAAAVTPASAHDFGGRSAYHRDRDSGRSDRDRHHGRHDRDHGDWGHRHVHRHHGWY